MRRARAGLGDEDLGAIRESQLRLTLADRWMRTTPRGRIFTSAIGMAMFLPALFSVGNAGTLAIAFRSIGFVGKLVGEALEESSRGTIEALTTVGAPWPSILLKGYWPQVEAAFWSIITATQ